MGACSAPSIRPSIPLHLPLVHERLLALVHVPCHSFFLVKVDCDKQQLLLTAATSRPSQRTVCKGGKQCQALHPGPCQAQRSVDLEAPVVETDAASAVLTGLKLLSRARHCAKSWKTAGQQKVLAEGLRMSRERSSPAGHSNHSQAIPHA